MKAAEKAELGDAADARAGGGCPGRGRRACATPMDAVGGEGVALDPAVALGAGHRRATTATNSNKIRETSATIGIGGNGDERRVPSSPTTGLH